MWISPPQRSDKTRPVQPVQRSRKYVDYPLRDEHDPQALTNLNESRQREAADDAAQAITALMQRLAKLRALIDNGAPFHNHHPNAAGFLAAFRVSYNDCLLAFDEHEALLAAWRLVLLKPMTAFIEQNPLSLILEGSPAQLTFDSAWTKHTRSRSQMQSNLVRLLFEPDGAAVAIRDVITRIMRSPAASLIETSKLRHIFDPVAYTYTPYSRPRRNTGLLLQWQG
ncbi:hypothetical protein PaecuDRAFT_1402 [Paenibacillus curdlanolyticus YK9]|uniref:Uncharacterized protein n=1 Tax=Paenibacillus curdlanolyticus YK9 TaxID=717606 RepID=E0I6Y0_9BACL|nr:hypothetical protein [Paenibacillus curdlanolyticus]EFM11796.1 hypothetical protein PaecuDRAFT_1402 [Paenibacillus curdlanolyticus YK9]